MAYLDRAAYFGNWAGELFFDDASGLPKVTSDHDFYEVGSGGGELALALADLENAVEDLLLGDANLDGDVDGLDIGVLVDNFGGDGGCQEGDFNFDGVVDGLDIGILVSNFGGSAAALEPLADLGYASIREPTCLILFTVAGAALLRRGRRAA